jgi:predicted CoA-substrate-specific enzyme activase
MAYLMGIDIGSTSSKGVILKSGHILAHHLIPSGGDYRIAAQMVRKELLNMAGLSEDDLSATAVTGHGVPGLPFEHQHLTDILCCARGISHHSPGIRTVIDIQGLSSRVIRLNQEGRVIDFTNSEKCAAGSGRFLEMMASILKINVAEMGDLSLKSKRPVSFTTNCAVFEESEVISRVAEGAAIADILAGAYGSLADKLVALVHRVGMEEDCALSGGSGLDTGLIKCLEERLEVELVLVPQPRLVTALGAAIMAGGGN